MAQPTLQNRIAASRSLIKGAGGVLEEQTPEEIQKLSQQAGLPAPPTTAMGGAMIGANPDQQKMMGGPAQMQAALNIAQTGAPTLAEATRRQQVRQTATQGEQSEIQKSQDLQNLGGVGDRVASFIDNERQKLAQAANQAPTQQVAATAPVGGGVTADNWPTLRTDLETFQKNPNDMQTLLRINQALGRDPNSTLRPEEIPGLYESAITSIARAGGQTIDQTLSVGDLAKLPDFGYSLPQLGQLLGVDPATLGSYSLGQLKDRVAQATQEEFSNAQQAGQAATNPLLGSAERAVGTQVGQEASRTGVRASEADMGRLIQAVDAAGTVQFGGQSWPVDQLLGDQGVSKLISDYLGSPEGSTTRTQLEQTEPSLVQFIKGHEAALTETSKQMSAGAQQFSAIQQANKDVATVDGATLDTSLLKEMLPHYGELASETIDPSKVPILQYAQGLPKGQGHLFISNINSLAQNPLTADVVPELSSLRPEELKTLGFESGDMRQNDFVGRLLTNRQALDALNATNPSDENRIAGLLTNQEITDSKTLQDKVAENTAAKTLGLPSQNLNALDRDGDGKLDSPAQLLQGMKAQTPKSSLRDIINGQSSTYQPVTGVASFTPKGDNADLQMRVFSALKDAASDGKLTTEEVAKAPFSEDDLYAIDDAGMDKAWGAAGAGIQDRIAASRTQKTGTLLQQFEAPKLDEVAKNIENVKQDWTHEIGGVTGGVRSPQSIQTLSDGANTYQNQIDLLHDEQKKYLMTGKGNRIYMDQVNQRLDQLTQARDLLRKTAGEWQQWRDHQIADLQAQADRAAGRAQVAQTQRPGTLVLDPNGTPQMTDAERAATGKDFKDPGAYDPSMEIGTGS